MDIAIIGANGLVATELIRRGLGIPEITSIIAVARRPVPLDANAPNISKVNTVIILDYEKFTDAVRAKLQGADVVIWTIAVTPFRHREFDFAEVKRVCQDCAIAGLKAVDEAATASDRTSYPRCLAQRHLRRKP